MGDIADYYIGLSENGWRSGRRYRGKKDYGPPQCRNCGSFRVRWVSVRGRRSLFNWDDNTPHSCLSTTCRICQTKGLKWLTLGGKWQLVDQSLNRHECTTSADGFDDEEPETEKPPLKNEHL